MSAEPAVLVSRGRTPMGADCPDLPRVVAAAETFEEVVALMREAIPAHDDRGALALGPVAG